MTTLQSKTVDKIKVKKPENSSILSIEEPLTASVEKPTSAMRTISFAGTPEEVIGWMHRINRDRCKFRILVWAITNEP